MKRADCTERKCPRCGAAYVGYPAISRINNAEICPDCGTREALDSLGLSAQEREQIIEIIHQHKSA